MNSSHKPQISPFFPLLGLVLLAAMPAGAALSQDAEDALELLRDRVSEGLAGQESYDAFLDFLAQQGEGGCETWSDLPEAGEAEIRWREIRAAMAAVCRDPAGPAEDAGDSNRQDTPSAAQGAGMEGQGQDSPRQPGGSAARIRLLAALAVRPRLDPQAGSGSPAPLLEAEAARPGIAGRLSLREYRPDMRFLRLGSARFSVLAGHLHTEMAETRLAFVTGSRFYAGWSGSSGVDGVLFSPRADLDGLGLRARAGQWLLEMAGTWNRLYHGSAPDRNDALLYAAGLARRSAGSAGVEFRTQAALERFEPGEGARMDPTEIAVAGASLSNRGDDLALWDVGAAASLSMPPSPAASGYAAPMPAANAWGGYLEASLASPRGNAETWRLQAHQADAGWANPLQSPRGYLRDTLDGRWITSGRGEGALSARSRFPVTAYRAYQADMQGGGAADWSLRQGLLAGEGSLALIQALGEWTHELGATAAFLRPGLRRPYVPGALSDGDGTMGRGGWGQSLAWRRGAWFAKASFIWKGGAYSGSLPAPVSLACEWKGATAWKTEILTGDIGNPARYLRLDVRQGWMLGNRIKVEQTLRLPWTAEGLASDTGYQLRLAAAL